MTGSCGQAVITAGEQLPAMSISWVKPKVAHDSGYCVIFADRRQDTPAEIVCLGCLVEDGDEQLGRGLDLARAHGQVDYDPQADEWFVPDDKPAEFVGEGES